MGGGKNSAVPISNDNVTLMTHTAASLMLLVCVFLPRIVMKVRGLQVNLLTLHRGCIFVCKRFFGWERCDFLYSWMQNHRNRHEMNGLSLTAFEKWDGIANFVFTVCI